MSKSISNYRENLCSTAELDIEKTFECGQCFRWNKSGDGGYVGVTSGRAARLWVEDERVYIDAPEADLPFWHDYFDLDTDYDAARESVSKGEYLTACAEHGAGIRILRQDKWETLCSFIISQCNNIPRIKGIVERMSAAFGEPIEYAGGESYAFPTPERIAPLEERDLACLHSGYRAPYILNAARAVVSGELDLEAAAKLPGAEARRELKRIGGVGEKVANCVVLYGFHQMDAFPVDVWIRRALKERLPPDFDPASLGEYAGLAQQYMFYAARSGES